MTSFTQDSHPLLARLLAVIEYINHDPEEGDPGPTVLEFSDPDRAERFLRAHYPRNDQLEMLADSVDRQPMDGEDPELTWLCAEASAPLGSPSDDEGNYDESTNPSNGWAYK
jgi:hypothetical protein